MVERIEKIRIPDDDIPGWLNLLMEMGLDQREIDHILRELNKTYAEQLDKNWTKSPESIYKIIEEERGISLTEDEKLQVRQAFGDSWAETLDQMRRDGKTLEDLIKGGKEEE
ncbi:MAG: hypothetical protein A3I07_04535 [Candidatus Doudnabacteria bacterium RIFCSPLOWO2_02_FULL_42_9]|uniref:Uncharacterized protein n=1 Tax=Candidatus Doudnabacteria bacterium RIFCSPHIGHO2_01_FULL_41_86 TaxID=1817821 RepID=A0A1F5N9H5_9BACT|nr:MAG: hypothetical protein A2717_01955 [Candidatus Doudnabacteria bacterium RIFCSPHIGHO2_01_FULL_41_86]OGE75086.1 MAG: hypothetical protein A3K07_03855 [Candidatus Doudnabacteria bacterium RIFCSPHIGHO2_01_43_10]OGE85328.1 MAG: hypothetical protein A3E28_01525 [Candidatus Doudnabacteria bacterium RIFCSPHIGHO2_12_FULL_42_22]OGE86866.1 MAG: hypothetical protein A3C49_02360 [Candidatus Doudnabacteria bacterium RIFCSPHIGHO2_02_FULL_42_25]OGE92465.1 MAG: hypothetical protein A2895_02515 [Candidatus